MQQDLRSSQLILASRASNINFINKATGVLMALVIDSVVPGAISIKIFGVLEWIPSNHTLQGLQSWRLVCHYTRTPNSLKYSRGAFNFVVGINFCRKKFIFEEQGFFEISEDKFPSKLTHYTVIY